MPATESGPGVAIGRPRASPKGSKLCGASRQPQGSIDMLPAACSIASGSEPGQAPLACTPTSPALRPCAVVGFGSMLPLEPQRTTEPANSAPVQSISAALAEAGQCAGSKAAQAEPSHAPLSPEPQKQGSPSSQHGTPGQGDGRQKSGLKIALKLPGKKRQQGSPAGVTKVATAKAAAVTCMYASCPAAQTGASPCTLHATAASCAYIILGQSDGAEQPL